jgi:ABC-2 type transport system permease protein
MIHIVIRNEWRQWWRDINVRWSQIALIFIGSVALWHQVDFQSGLASTRQQAQHDSREEWLRQDVKHPHVAAHFGNYAYKKPSLLHCFDPGLSIYTGTSVYMEPHRQNDFLFSKGQESDTGIRFGWLSPAMICQLVLPLFIILLSFNSINGEVRRGTMPLLLTQGISFRKLLLAKTLAVFILLECLLTLYLAASGVAAVLFVGGGFDFLATAYIWMVYTLYALCWSLIAVYVSAKTTVVGSSISILLLIWMFSCVIVPRISANVAENMYALSTNYEFKKQIAQDIEKGLNGHDTQSKRARRIEAELLAKYHVDSVQKLPFNFEGYIMQQGEEYSSKVYDVHFASIFQSLKNQKAVQSWLSVLSPYIALRNVSMAASNASLESEIDFQLQAEAYRRKFVQELNNDMMNKSAYGSFDTYRVQEGTYAAIDDLEVANHTLSWSLPHVVTENVLLVSWTLLMIMLTFITTGKEVYR